MRVSARRRIFVDPRVQCALLFRVALYWFFCVFALSLILYGWEMVAGTPASFSSLSRLEQMWQEYGFLVLASLFLLPIVMVDLVIMSNRFSGPQLRLRRTLRALAAGERAEPIQFRDNDFWQEVAREVNAVAAYIERLKRQNSHAEPQPLLTDDQTHLEVLTRH